MLQEPRKIWEKSRVYSLLVFLHRELRGLAAVPPVVAAVAVAVVFSLARLLWQIKWQLLL